MIFLTKSRAGTFLEGFTFGAFGGKIMVVAHHCFVSIQLFWMSLNVHPAGNQSSQYFLTSWGRDSFQLKLFM